MKDDAEAVKWYRKSAEQGFAFAQRNLGVHYAVGSGVAQDHTTRMRGHHFSSQWGQNCFKNEFATRKENDPEQIAEAQELAKEMIKKNPKLIND